MQKIVLSILVLLLLSGLGYGALNYKKVQNLGASILTVPQGGTGSSTLSGILKGNGTGGIKTAIYGVDYGNGTVTSVGLTAPIGFTTSSPITTSGNLALGFSSGYSLPLTASTTEGSNAYVSIAQNGANWTTAYTNRIDTATLPMSIASNNISMTQCSSTTNGWLSNSDYNTFNNKADASSVSGLVTLYHWNQPATDVTGYEGFRTVPNNGTEIAEATTTTATNQYVLIDSYVSSSTATSGALSFTSIPAGTWNFHTYAMTSSAAGSNFIVYNMYRRASSGVETFLFQATSTALTTSVSQLQYSSTQPTFSASPDGTDRMVAKVYFFSSANGRTGTFYYDDSVHYSHIETTFNTISSGYIRTFDSPTITGAFTFSNNTYFPLSVFNSSGKLGIGTTTSLTYPLSIYDVSNASIYYNNGTVRGYTGVDNTIPSLDIGTFSNHDVRIETNNTEKVRITAGGKVGIGTTSPSQILDVWGNLNIGTSVVPILYADSGSQSVGIGTTTFASTNKEKVKIQADNTENAISVVGSVNDFLQYTIQNTSTATGSQSGFAATANNGTATTNFAWMGINNPQFNYPAAFNVGLGGDVTYLGLGNDMYIANGTAAKKMYFMTGGTATSTNLRMTIDGSGKVGIGTSSPTDNFSVAVTSWFSQLVKFWNSIILVAGSYINFGVNSGTTGFGFRENLGKIETKDQYGNWKGVSSNLKCTNLINATTTSVSQLMFDNAVNITKVSALYSCTGACTSQAKFNFTHSTSTTATQLSLFTNDQYTNSSSTPQFITTGFANATTTANSYFKVAINAASTTQITNLNLCVYYDNK